MRFAFASVVCGSAALFAGGCYVSEHHHPVYYETRTEVELERPVIEDPAVVRIDVEPAPVERVYIYEPGYPPGCYAYNGFVWYGGYRYPRTVFVERYVTVNVHEHRYVNVVENRRVGHTIEERHRTEYVTTKGVRRSTHTEAVKHTEPVKHAETTVKHTETTVKHTAGVERHVDPKHVETIKKTETTVKTTDPKKKHHEDEEERR